MSQMKQMQHSSFSQIRTSDEIAEEAKKYLVCNTSNEEIQYEIKKCLSRFVGTPYNISDVEIELTNLFNQFKNEYKVSQFNIRTHPDNSIHIQYMKNLSAEVVVLDIKII